MAKKTRRLRKKGKRLAGGKLLRKISTLTAFKLTRPMQEEQ